MFYNHITRQQEANGANAVEAKQGAWFIKMGYAGFNSPSNNAWGYKSQASAQAAILRYQAKGEAHRRQQAARGQ